MLLTAAVAAVAVALFVIVVRTLPGAPTALTLPWVLWAAAFAVSEALVVHVQWQREAHTFSIGDLVLGAGLLLCHPARPGDRPGASAPARHAGPPPPSARASSWRSTWRSTPSAAAWPRSSSRLLAGRARARGTGWRALVAVLVIDRRPPTSASSRSSASPRAGPTCSPCSEMLALSLPFTARLGRGRPGRRPHRRRATRRRWRCWRCRPSSSSPPTAPTPGPASSRRTCACCTR